MKKIISMIAGVPGLLLLLAVSLILSLRFGSVAIGTDEIARWISGMAAGTDSSSVSMILYNIRLPRTIFAAVCGMGLALSGLVLQTITGNDLSDPYVLGVSSGASTGAVSAIVLGWFSFFGNGAVTGAAFVGAALSTAIVIALTGNHKDPSRLVLVGIGISAFFSAVTMMIVYFAPHESQVRSAMFWLMGSFSGIRWEDIPVAAAIVVLSAVILFMIRYQLDVFLLGDEEAAHLGLNIPRMKLLVILITSVMVAVLVSEAGVVGFIGLITPHMARRLTGAVHGKLIPESALLGAIVMIWADVLSRSVAAPSEIPVGVLTSLFGAPLFLYIVLRKADF